MACEWVKVGDTLAMVCSRRNKRRMFCQFCRERPATKLCDFEIESGKTCDASICDHCATHSGRDTDYCPSHKGATKQGELF